MVFSKSWESGVDIKLDRLLSEIEFIKNRTAIYLGRNEALTYLSDETPIFVNTDDYGCPLNFINGGKYEEDYHRVFLSFRKPGLAILDIGANLGVYSLRMATYMRAGEIHAFEPIPRIRNLFSRSVFLNGFHDRIKIYPYAVSDRVGNALLSVPEDHAGGAFLNSNEGESIGISVEVKCLDDLLPSHLVCGLVKIDVEGHELHALKGMHGLLTRSPNAVVLFEKLASNSGIENDIYEFFQQLGWSIYGIDRCKLFKFDLSDFKASGGYFVASLNSNIDEEGLDRDFFHIYPSDLNIMEGHLDLGVLKIDKQLASGSVIFHGPYWWLPRGYYRLTVNGEINSKVTLDVCERFGYKTAMLELEPNRLTVDFLVHRDLIKFELVMRATTNNNLVANMRSIKLEKIG